MSDTPLGYQELAKHIPALVESGALETIGAIAWRGYQKHGKGVVIYIPTYGDLEFMTAREYATTIRDMLASRPASGEAPTAETLQDYDPFVEVLFATLLGQPGADKGGLVLFKIRPPKPPQRCRVVWRPTPPAKTA